MQQLDKKIRLKLELLNATCKNLPIVVYTTDNNNVCTIADGNEEIMLGDMHAFELVGKTIEEIFPDKQSILTVHESALKGYHGSYEWYVNYIAIEVFVRPYVESDGTISGSIAAGIDVSDSRKFEKQLIDSRQKAEKALRIKSEFLNVMSHEIRTPLNAIIGISHLLLEDKPNQSQLENLEILKYSAENLLSLINDVLDYGKLESGKVKLDLRPVRIKQLVDSSIKALELKAREKGLLLKCIYDQDIPEGIITDSTRLNQVINNLVSNAVKFTDKGYVTLRLLYRNLPANKVAIRFLIEDTGIGIANEKLETIFEEFIQADDQINHKYGGSGLGLSISKFLVEFFGGKLAVNSTVGKGSVFQFELIFDKVDLAKEPTVEPVDINDPLTNLDLVRVLLVDDNRVNRKIAARFLSKWKMEVFEAADGMEALEIAKTNIFDVILMDLQMPIMDGYDSARAIMAWNKKHGKFVPIIAVTAETMDDVRTLVNDIGMVNMVSKPFKPDELFRVISEATRITN